MKLSKVEATSFFETNKYSQPSEYNYSHKFYFMIKNPLPRFEPPTCSTVQCVPNLNSMIKASMIHSKQSRHPCFKSQYTFKINTLHPNNAIQSTVYIKPFHSFKTLFLSLFKDFYHIFFLHTCGRPLNKHLGHFLIRLYAQIPPYFIKPLLLL